MKKDNIRKFKSQRRDDALTLFFTLLNSDKERKSCYENKIDFEFKNSKLPEILYDDFRILYFLYLDNGYKHVLRKESSYDFIDTLQTSYEKLEIPYVRNQVKKYVKDSLIKKYNEDDDLYIELEDHNFIKSKYLNDGLQYVSNAIVDIMKTKPKNKKI
jgi:hypothetical protein